MNLKGRTKNLFFSTGTVKSDKKETTLEKQLSILAQAPKNVQKQTKQNQQHTSRLKRGHPEQEREEADEGEDEDEENEDEDIDRSTALITLYNLLNELAYLNKENRRSAEELALKFSALQNCYDNLEQRIEKNELEIKRNRKMYNNRHIGSMASKHFEFERKSDEHIVRDISDKTSLTITEDKADDLYSELAIPSASRSAHDKQTKLSSFEDSSPSMLLYDYTSLNSDLSSLPNLNSSLPSNPSLPSATVPTDSRTPLHKSESAFTYDQLSSCLDTITSGDFLTSFNSSNLNNSSLLNSVPSLNHNNQSADFVSLTTTVGSSPSIPANFNLSHTSSSLVYEKPNTTPATTTTASAAAVTVVFTDSSSNK